MVFYIVMGKLGECTGTGCGEPKMGEEGWGYINGRGFKGKRKDISIDR